jgi:hypothetical protein
LCCVHQGLHALTNLRRFTSTKVQLLTQISRTKVQILTQAKGDARIMERYSIHLLYYHKSTNTDAKY